MASMIEEIEVPKDPQLWTCSCCLFSFRDVNKFFDHLVEMRKRLDADIARAEKAKVIKK